MLGRTVSLVAGLLAGVLVLSGCPTTKRLSAPMPEATPIKSPAWDTRRDTPVPTVPPGTPEALPTRPIPHPNLKATKGHPIGPVITLLGAAKADGTPLKPMSVDKQGVPTYLSYVGSGFILLVEAKPGPSNYEVGRSVFQYEPKDASKRPDLQIEVNRPLGDGSTTVCDRRMPNIGGVPAIRPPSFKDTQKISDTLNDLACRFEIFIDSASSCTVTPQGGFSFVNSESTTQFCMIVARAWAFPVGTTEVTARLRDVNGNPGPVKRMKIYRPKELPRPKPVRTPFKKPTPKALPTRP
jgi:hypothetical protein